MAREEERKRGIKGYSGGNRGYSTKGSRRTGSERRSNTDRRSAEPPEDKHLPRLSPRSHISRDETRMMSHGLGKEDQNGRPGARDPRFIMIDARCAIALHRL